MRSAIAVLLGLVFVVPSGCAAGDATTDESTPGAGLSGSGGSIDGGAEGAAASAGSGGGAGEGGAGGVAGAAGASGAAGSGGTSGAAGAAGSGGTSGAAGAAGSGGTSGAAGAAGSGGSGGPGDPCTTDADCKTGNSCQVVPNAAQTALELQCAPNVGTSGPGIGCATGATCRSGQCILGYCSTPCSATPECVPAAACRGETLSVGGLSGAFDMCVVIACSNSTDCDPGEVCSELRTEAGKLVAHCRQAQAGGAPVGDTCAANADCASVMCPDWVGFCTEICSSDADCIAPAPQACVNVWNNGTSSLTSCAPRCDALGDCPAPSQCMFATDSITDQNRFICGDGWGTAPVGADCSTTNDCSTGLCLQNYLNGQLVDSICTAPCETGTDCPVGYQVCANVQMQTPSGTGMQTLRLCNHP